ncbi:hypothetical protein EXS73_03305 [Candidatus Pacearchaeota archaeon]|nr:hypothetical protein [Candidatus Pacearchaeota archaeon]
MNPAYTKLIIGLVVLLGILAGFGLYLGMPLLTGAEATLATQPIDPFDPLRGQYIIIRYEIGTLEKENVSIGNILYVSLKDDAEGIARLTKVSTEKPKSGLFIKGTVERVSGNQATLQYGIEQYFFERGAQFSTQNVQVKVKIDSSGQARIKELVRDGKPIEMSYRNISYKS